MVAAQVNRDTHIEALQVSDVLFNLQGWKNWRKGECAILAISRWPCQARRLVWVHFVRMLLDIMSVVLVERRQILRPSCAYASIPLDYRLTWWVNEGSFGFTERSVQCLQMPHHHELHQNLPERFESRQSHRWNQEASRRNCIKGRTRTWDSSSPQVKLSHEPQDVFRWTFKLTTIVLWSSLNSKILRFINLLFQQCERAS